MSTWALALLVFAALLSGCANSPPTSAPGGNTRVEEHAVTISRYDYQPGTDLSLNVTLGNEVVLHLTSTDVTHGFAILEYGINVEVPPGQRVEVRFTADQAGDFVIYCTVFCGSGHPQHKGVLHVA